MIFPGVDNKSENELKQSPEYLQTSLAAAMTLGYKKGLFWRNAKMTCINLLLTYSSGCKAACSYCGLQRKRIGGPKSFIRVPWDTFPTEDIIDRINISKIPKRICISMITHQRAVADTIHLTKLFSSKIKIPISLLISPTLVSKSDLYEMKESGADKIGIAFDLPTPELFDKYRGKNVGGPHTYEKYKQCFKDAVEIFGEWQVGSHFMVGLGETEKELIEAIQWVHDQKGVNHLFSFFPEAGTVLESKAQPSIDVYRRIQIATHLIDTGKSSIQKMKFDTRKCKIIDYGISEKELLDIIDKGKPFETRGCLGNDGNVACNRPYANSFPGPDLRNYPFPPDKEDIDLIKTQLK